MPKPANVERFIREWLHAEGHDELLGYARCITASASITPNAGSSYQSVTASSADPGSVARLLGRDPADNALLLGTARAFVLTSTRLLSVRLSGWKERVKDAEIDVDAAGVVVHHLDSVQSRGHTARYFLADLPDGRWMLDSMVVATAKGSPGPFAAAADGFIAALGDRARPISAT